MEFPINRALSLPARRSASREIEGRLDEARFLLARAGEMCIAGDDHPERRIRINTCVRGTPNPLTHACESAKEPMLLASLAQRNAGRLRPSRVYPCRN